MADINLGKVVGNGIVSIELTETIGKTNTYTILFTNGETTEFQVINGSDGNDGDDGVSISNVEKTNTQGLIDTYTITMSNNVTYNFTVTNGEKGEDGNNGVGIVSVLKTGTAGLIDTYTITYTDNTTSTFTVTNGADGSGGGGTSNHADLTNKDYDSSGHTGFQKSLTAEQLANIDDIPNKVSSDEIPTALPNPNAITFTGAVEEVYDGSVAKTINIPTGGSSTATQVSFDNVGTDLTSTDVQGVVVELNEKIENQISTEVVYTSTQVASGVDLGENVDVSVTGDVNNFVINSVGTDGAIQFVAGSTVFFMFPENNGWSGDVPTFTEGKLYTVVYYKGSFLADGGR